MVSFHPDKTPHQSKILDEATGNFNCRRPGILIVADHTEFRTCLTIGNLYLTLGLSHREILVATFKSSDVFSSTNSPRKKSPELPHSLKGIQNQHEEC